MFFKTTPKNLKKKFIVAFPVLSEQCPYLFTKNRTTNHNAVSDFLVRDFKIYTKIYEKLQRTLLNMPEYGIFSNCGEIQVWKKSLFWHILRSQNNRNHSVSAKVTDQKITKKS